MLSARFSPNNNGTFASPISSSDRTETGRVPASPFAFYATASVVLFFMSIREIQTLRDVTNDSIVNPFDRPEPIALGSRLRDLRRERNWTLEEAAEHCGVARSTLSKIERDQMSPTFDLLTRLTSGFNLNITELFVAQPPPAGAARRAITRAGMGRMQDTQTYHHEFLCTDIVCKQMLPFTSRIKARSAEDFEDWVRHDGEEFLFVLKGSVQVLTEFYEPAVLGPGDSIYFDSRMGHFVTSFGKDDALVLWVCSR